MAKRLTFHMQATCTAFQSGRDDLVDTVVAPAAAEAAASMLTTVREDCNRVRKYLARLKEVSSSTYPHVDLRRSYTRQCCVCLGYLLYQGISALPKACSYQCIDQWHMVEISEQQAIENTVSCIAQLRQKREAMEAVLTARQEDEDDVEQAGDNMSDISSAVSGLSAYTTRSAAATSAPTGTASIAPSTVGGRRPQQRRVKKVCTTYAPI